MIVLGYMWYARFRIHDQMAVLAYVDMVVFRYDHMEIIVFEYDSFRI